ncbi:GNAT family N-acetyltransferase [bacterium]|nr:MAG: GNAT family N-acetyltransferase [bacterium]
MEFYAINADNLTHCVELFVTVFNSPPWNESWRPEAVVQRLDECFRTPNFYGLLAKVEGETVAFALGYGEQWDQSQHFYLKEMCVATQQQRSGVGTALMEQLEQNLKSRGVEKIYLYTARDSGAQSFYEKQDFYVSSRTIMMAKWLKPK